MLIRDHLLGESDPELKLLSEVILDFDNTDDIKYIRSCDGYVFNVDGVEYIFRGWGFNNNTLWRVKFGIHEGSGKIKDVEMTNSHDIKNTTEVLSKVSKSFLMFIKQYNPQRIDFDADRPSRQKMYERLFLLLYKRKEFQNYTPLGKSQSDSSGTIYYSIERK